MPRFRLRHGLGTWLISREFDLKDRWPLFSGDEEAAVLIIVGDAVEHRFAVILLGLGEKAGAVEPCLDVTVSGRDSGDAVRVPDVGVDLPVDVLELIEIANGRAVVADGDLTDLVESVWAAEAQDGGAVGGNQFRGGAGHAPAFSVVVELTNDAERGAIVDKADVRLPCPLKEVVMPVDDSFAEVRAGEVVLQNDAAGGWFGDDDGGVTLTAGAFVEVPVAVEEALSVVGS